MCLVGVVVRRYMYIDFLIIITYPYILPLYLHALFAAASLLFFHLKKCFLYIYIYNDSEIIVLTRWGSLSVTRIITSETIFLVSSMAWIFYIS